MEKIPLVDSFPWLPLVDQATEREISAFLPDQLSINNFYQMPWCCSLDLMRFTCTHDIIFGPSATRVHRFYCEGTIPCLFSLENWAHLYVI